MQTYGTYIMRFGSTERKWPAARWLRVRAAAAYLGVGVGTLNKLRTYGGGPLYSKMMAGVVAYDIADLDAWATRRKICNTSEPVRAA